MSDRYVYQLTETLILNSPMRESVEHNLGVFRSLSVAENFLREYLKNGKFFYPLYCFAVKCLPISEELDYDSMRQINIYSPDGRLQISESNLLRCGGAINKRLNLCARISIDISLNKKSYFTLYNNWRRRLATKCARISFLESKYELSTSYSKSVWFLNESEKKKLMEFLNIKRPFASDNEPSNNWQSVIRTFNNIIRGDETDRILPYDTPIPDYTKLEP
ncbi:hypothetical protein [uncultured Fibrobacter sp.]|uniref:hypothetical protein n=1 Tax=uncultured Fibrobacter sp. TaxID=261512 RepID=UPI0025E9A996|nr:hypothetical protein [uncultured Fibrobacter sp.]